MLSRLGENAEALATGKLDSFDEAWEAIRRELDGKEQPQVFQPHWEEGTGPSSLMMALDQISNLLPSSPAEELWPLILKIGMHKPHLPRGLANSANRRPSQNILGRFVADSAKVEKAAEAHAQRPEIWPGIRRGDLVFHCNFRCPTQRVRLACRQNASTKDPRVRSRMKRSAPSAFPCR